MIFFYLLHTLILLLECLFAYFLTQHSKNGVFEEKSPLPHTKKTQRAFFLEILGVITIALFVTTSLYFDVPSDDALGKALFQANVMFIIIMFLITVSLAPTTIRYVREEVTP